jgi:hypothetical protein
MKRWACVLMVLLAACALLHVVGPDYPPSIDFEAWAAPEKPPVDERRYEDEAEGPEPRGVDLLRAEDFAFAMGVGSGMHALEVFRVNGSGQVSYLFRGERGWWWRAEFQVSAEAVARLRRLLVEVNYLSLKRRYYTDWMDGTQWCIRVDAGGVTKKVYCDNHFPPPAVRLASFIGRELLPAHEAEIQKAGRIRESDARRAASDLW